MKEKHHFAADVDADYYMANSGYGVSNHEKQSKSVSIHQKHNCESNSAKVESRICLK